MKIREYERAFSDPELARGAELYFSGELTDTDIKKLRQDGTEVRLSGSVSEWDAKGKKVKRNCAVTYSADRGILLSAFCPCAEFQKDGYGCLHTAALLTAYYVSLNGKDAFRGTRLEQLLKNLTMVDDPFHPGVIRRTDERLQGLLKDAEEEKLPVWQDGNTSAPAALYRSECSLHFSDGDVYLEMRLGAGRLYVIKDLKALLKAYQEGGSFTLGRNEARIAPGDCEENTRVLLELLNDEKNASGRAMIFALDQQKFPRYIKLYGRYLDRFMELSDSSTVTTDPHGPLHIDLAHRGLMAAFRKKTYGASLQIREQEVLCSGDDFCYVLDEDTLFRVPAGTLGAKNQLKGLLSLRDSLYVRESDILNVYRNILPVFESFGTLTLKGMDPEDYEKEKPSFRFALDYERNEELLTCRAFSVYPSSGKEYVMFGAPEDVSRRNGAEETRAAEVVRPLFDTYDRESGVLSRVLEEQELYLFLRDRLPELEKLGIVVGTDSFRRLRIRRLPALSVGISAGKSGLMMSLAGAGMSAEEMDEILSAYSRKKNYFRLKSGAFVTLPGQEEQSTWDTCAELYRHYGKKDPEAMKLPLFRALYLREMLENRDDAVVSEEGSFIKLCEKMDPQKGKTAKIPESLGSVLRPYQAEGFRWICTLKQSGFGGILADDMGLGKTLQVIAFLLSEKLSGKTGDRLRALVICPASLVYNWQKEIARFAPELSSVCITGSAAARGKLLEEERDKDVFITSYDLLKRDINLYEELSFASEIIDEAQYIKNQNTQASQSVRVIKSGFRLALTGTPIENHLSELWSIMDYLMPGFLYTYTRFQKEFEAPVAAEQDEEVLQRLRRMTHPFILRRLKKQVLKELPEKLEETVTVRMEGEQRKLYDALANEVRLSLRNTSDSEFRTGKLQFLAQLTKLREVCCDPALLYENYSGGSAKLEACMQLVGQAVEGGHKVLLFSQFTSMLDRICAGLTEQSIRYHRIDGSVGKEERMEMVESFADDDVPVFCISLKAGGTGLNLTAADIVIHYDPWWNQAAQDQATDRTHRIGQTRVVTVYELIAGDSVEEQIRDIKDSKKKLAEDVLSGEAIASASISREDMLQLVRER